MLRKLVTLSIIAMLAATAFGAAASLTFDGGTIQFGVDDSLICDPDGVQVEWLLDSYFLALIFITDINDACLGNTLGWALGDGQGTIFDTDFVEIVVPTTVIPLFLPPEDAEYIEVLKLWITGPNSLAPAP